MAFRADISDNPERRDREPIVTLINDYDTVVCRMIMDIVRFVPLLDFAGD